MDVAPEGDPATLWAVSRDGLHLGAHTWHGNINLLSIVHACRLALGPVFQGGLAAPGTLIGGKGSHFCLFIRYSCLHSHSHTLHSARSLGGFTRHDVPLTLDRRPGCRMAFGGVLEPRYIIGAKSLDQ